jgi:tetratricopeptide (TPR) repeat protein
MRHWAALIALMAGAAPAAAQDVVRLRSGKVLSGTVRLDEGDKEGFRLVLWDTGGTIYVRWSQLPEAEKNRLLGRSAPDSGAPQLELLDGIRVLTPTREEVGLLVREDAQQILIKTRHGRAPVPVPTSALLKPYEKIKIRESDAYSPEEMVERRLARAGDKDAAALLEIARFATGLRLYDRAREIYQKAASADPSRKDEIDTLLAANERLVKEDKAAALVRDVKELLEDTEYAKALELARRLPAEFGDTEVARQNKDLAALVEKEAKDFEQKKTELLAQKVPEAYKAKRSALLSEYSGSRYKLSQARALVAKIDEEVVKYLAAKFKSTPEEIQAAWGKREPKTRTASYGEGSWIVRGGQDGGLDTDAKFTPRDTSGSGNNEGGGNNRRRPTTPPKPVDLGKKLPTSEEWWASASQGDRKSWLEAEYAKTSSAVRKEIRTRKCGACNGEGVLKSHRMGVACEVKCARCHGAKEDEIVQYW